ncbi:hypothetical protein LCGC14_2386300, partial [marine sediment metagenome]
MQGLHGFEPETRTVIDLESFIPDDHLLREVDRFIERAFIRKLDQILRVVACAGI